MRYLSGLILWSVSFVCLYFSSCSLVTPIQKMDEQELRDLARELEWHPQRAIYYQGRKDGYDYFLIEWSQESRIVRLPASNGIVKNVMLYSDHREVWFNCLGSGDKGWLP